MTATLERADLAAMTDAELAGLWSAGGVDLASLEAECARRDKAGKIRAASRARNGDWEAAARASFERAEEFCRGDDNMLSPRGKAAGISAWDLWHGSEERARRYASDDLLRFWDYHQPRPPGPSDYRAAEREAAAEQYARQDMPSPGMTAAIAAARGEAKQDSPAPVAARVEPGSMVRFTALLRGMRMEAEQYARSLARVNGRIRQ